MIQQHENLRWATGDHAAVCGSRGHTLVLLRSYMHISGFPRSHAPGNQDERAFCRRSQTQRLDTGPLATRPRHHDMVLLTRFIMRRSSRRSTSSCTELSTRASSPSELQHSAETMVQMNHGGYFVPRLYVATVRGPTMRESYGHLLRARASAWSTASSLTGFPGVALRPRIASIAERFTPKMRGQL